MSRLERGEVLSGAFALRAVSTVWSKRAWLALGSYSGVVGRSGSGGNYWGNI